MNRNFSRTAHCYAVLTLVWAISSCGGSTPIAGEGNTPTGTGGDTMAVHLPDAGVSSGGTTPSGVGGATGGTGMRPAGTGGVMGGGAAGRGGTATACVVGTACGQGFGCDQPCRMAGRAGLIACSCGTNNRVSCGMCAPGAAPTCLPGVFDGQGCVPGTAAAAGCHTACTNGVQATCACVPGMAGRGGGGAMSGTWRCVDNRGVCTP